MIRRIAFAWLLLAGTAAAQTTIVASVVWSDNPQKDGRRWITERHTDSEGGVHFVTYMAEQNADATEMLPLRAAQIEEQLNAPPPPEPEKAYTISQIEAAFKDAEKGGLDLNKLKESLGKVDAGEITVVPVDVDPVVPVEPLDP